MYLPAFLAAYFENISYVGIFILLLLVNFTPFPEELLVLAVGYVSALGFIKFYIAIPVVIVSLFFGDNILFWLSRKGRYHFEKIEKYMMQEKFARYKKWMDAHINEAVFFSRFINSLRFVGIFLAGSKKMDIKKFQIYDLAALLIYVPMLTFLGGEFYNQATLILGKVEEIRHLPFIFFLIIIGILSNIFFSNKINNIRQK